MTNPNYKRHKRRNKHREPISTQSRDVPTPHASDDFQHADIAEHSQHVGMIEDMDAIDRLIGDDSFHGIEEIHLDDEPYPLITEIIDDELYAPIEHFPPLHADADGVEEHSATIAPVAKWLIEQDRLNVDEFVRQTRRGNPEPSSQLHSPAAAMNPQSTPTATIPPEILSTINDAVAQLKQLKAELHNANTEMQSLKGEMAETDMQQTAAITQLSETIKLLQLEQKKMQRQLIQEQDESDVRKKGILAPIALSFAIFAVMLAAAFGFLGLRTNSKISDLTDLVGSLKSKVDIFAASHSDEAVQQMNQRLTEMSASQAMLSNQIAALNSPPVADNKNNKSDATKSLTKTPVAMVESVAENTLGTPSEAEKPKPAKKPVIKPIPTAAKTVATDVKKKPAAATATAKTGTWNVNFSTIDQESEAKKQVNELSKQGIPVLMTKTENNGKVRYRLSVKGFKTQKEADEYAKKVKKTQRTTSTWIDKSEN